MCSFLSFRVSRNSTFQGSERNRTERASANCFLKVNRVFFFVLEWYGTSFLKFPRMVRNEIPSGFLFCKMVRNGLERSWECFSLLYNGLYRNSDLFYVQRNCIVFLFYKMVWTRIPSFFIFRGMAWNGIPSGFRSAKQMEFRRNESKYPSPWGKIFLGKWQPQLWTKYFEWCMRCGVPPLFKYLSNLNKTLRLDGHEQNNLENWNQQPRMFPKMWQWTFFSFFLEPAIMSPRIDKNRFKKSV